MPGPKSRRPTTRCGLGNHPKPSCYSKIAYLLASFTLVTAQAQNQVDARLVRLKQLSVDELMDIEVTSVTKSAEPLFDAAAAIAVVSNEDIRRSGATSIPESLRYVPGMHVAQENANSWAVSSRGFSSVSSEKLLVLSDTRSIYTPLYSGVFWDVQDYLFEDLERIEVIRGPGAALWGSNAVNGVINIQTKSAAQTQGTYLEAQAGTERAMAAARHGGQIGDDVYYRVFVKHTELDATFNPTSASNDESRLTHAGFRTDWTTHSMDQFTVQGDVYDGEIGRLAPSVNITGRPGPQGLLRTAVKGGNLLGRWKRSVSEDAHTQVRVYYDHTHRDDPSYLDDLDTFDADFQQRFPFAQRHALTWGLNYRLTDNSNTGKVLFALEPTDSRDTVISGFAQDRFTLSDSLYFDLGTKLEDNEYSGFEIQPSLHGAWKIRPSQILWGAVSRAVRVPTRLERDISIDTTDPASNPIVRLVGNRDFDSEKMLAYELGYRWQASQLWSLDLAAFRNQYQGLASLELGTPFVENGRTVYPVINKNLTDGRSQGLEALLRFTPRPDWQLTANYSYIDLQLDPHGQDINRGRFIAGSTPRHQAGLRSLMDLPANLQLDVQARYVSRIRHLPAIVDGSGLAGYTEMDLRVGWRPVASLELSVVGRNLLHSRHAEFGTPERRGEIERSVYGKASWSF